MIGFWVALGVGVGMSVFILNTRGRLVRSEDPEERRRGRLAPLFLLPLLLLVMLSAHYLWLGPTAASVSGWEGFAYPALGFLSLAISATISRPWRK